jgi:hypothetical protein
MRRRRRHRRRRLRREDDLLVLLLLSATACSEAPLMLTSRHRLLRRLRRLLSDGDMPRDESLHFRRFLRQRCLTLPVHLSSSVLHPYLNLSVGHADLLFDGERGQRRFVRQKGK